MQPYVLILAGGSGTRLWPLSREKRPKQILKLYSKYSLIQNTYQRAKSLTKKKNIFIGTNKYLKKLIRKQTPELKRKNFIIEPLGKNSAPIIAYFCMWLKKSKKDIARPIIVLSADHYISSTDLWVDNIKNVLRLAKERIWCLGVKPTRADTGYGYIHIGSKVEKNLYEINSFKEKPSKEKAKVYYENSKYLWNSGMFIFTADLFLSELQKTNPTIFNLAKDCAINKSKLKEKFPKMPSISVDYAVLEKSDKLGVVVGSFKWDDIGSFLSFERVKIQMKIII